MPFTDWANFAAIYNDVAAHPQLADVAYALGVSYQTVRNKTVIARKLREKGADVPELIWRNAQGVTVKQEEEEPVTPQEHAAVRANTLAEELNIFSGAQNDAEVHEGFWANLLGLCGRI
jgi:hypothetical protein